ncbi:hypothetical protein LPJ53_005094 [Coemansia erecta]|uniref:Uncharacterized protein n=1 Tax=Coemansia erecta TaxID=147472 RepID=A0A9W7XWD9_9FUNG|nr:hypothetical protein LPJ53_005094 [Coemansia erecta]
MAADTYTNSALLLSNSDLVMRIVRMVFWIESEVSDRYHRLEYLQHVFRLSMVSQAWRRILEPYLDSHLVVRITQTPKPTLLQKLTFARHQIQTLSRRLSLSGRGNEPARGFGQVPVATMRQTNGALLQFSSNIHRAAASRVHTIVLSVDGLLFQQQIDLGLHALGFRQREWTEARTLCLQLEAEANCPVPYREVQLAHEQTVQMVLEHAPHVASFFMVRLQMSHVRARISLLSAFARNPRVRRLEVHSDIGCVDLPPCLPMLTSLAISIEPGSAATRRLPCMASRSLVKLELHNVDPDVFQSMCEVQGTAVKFAELRSLRVQLRTRQYGEPVPDPPADASLSSEDSSPLVFFPRLESAHIFGYQHRVPVGLFPALVAAPLRHLYIYLGIRDVLELELQNMRYLQNLRVFLPQIGAVQPVLDSVFARPAEYLHTVSIYTHMRLDGLLPNSLELLRMRKLRLGALVPFRQVRTLVSQLPLLVYLKTNVAKDADAEAVLTFAEMADRVLEYICPVESRLQVLKLWHYEGFCTTDGRLSVRAAMVAGLLASIPSIVRFRGKVSVRDLRTALARILDSEEVAARAGHLRYLEIEDAYE